MPKSNLDRLLKLALLLLVIAFGWVIHDQFEQRIVEVGQSGPDFSITTESGKKITRSNFGGKLLVLNFWATWCPPCVEEMPSLNEFASQMKSEGVVVLGVSIDKNEKAYKTFVQRAGLSFETALDKEANIATDYGTFKWPETYIIDPSGKVVDKMIGPKTWTDPQMIASIKAHL